MLLVFITAILAVCGAAKLDKNYSPPITAKTAGGTPEILLAPVERSNPPTGSYVNDEEGVVVDAVAPGTRTSGVIPTGLGGPRTAYGSTNSKVGNAAFTAPVSAFGSNIATRISSAFNSIVGVSENKGDYKLRILPVEDPSLEKKPSDSEKSHANTLKFDNEISKEKYSYGYETDNGIFVGENGVARDGIEANGGYSYEGDDGKVYSVSYTADKDGYRPKGSHLPTPPPIPVEIVKSLEDNARDEAKGIVDDGSYDAQKYNIENEYSNDNHKNDPSTNGDATDSFIINHGNHENQFNSKNHEFNTQAPEFLGNQSHYKYNSFGFGEHVFDNKHFGFKENAEINHRHIGFKSPFALYNTGFSSPDKSISNPHATYTQQNKGTIYHYDKPSVTIFSNKETLNLSRFQLVDGTSLTKQNEQQNSFGSSTESHFGQHLQLGSRTSVGAVAQSQPQSQYDRKGFGSQSAIGTYTSTQKGYSSVQQFGQNNGLKGQSTKQTTVFGQQPFGSSQTTSATLSQNTFGSTPGSQFGQSLQQQQQQSTVLGTKEKIALQNSPDFQFVTKVKNSQSTTGTLQTATKSSSPVSHFGQNIGTKGQSTQQELGQKPFGFSQTKYSSLSQYSIGSSPGSQFGQHLQPGSGSSTSAVAQDHPQSQYNTKAFGSQSATGNFPLTQKGSSSVSQFGQNTGTKGQSTQQITGFGQQPFGSSQTTSSTFSQNTFSGTSSSQSGQNPQKQQSTVLGTKGKIDMQNSPDSQFATKVESSQSTAGTLQSSIESSSPVPKFGQNTGFKGQSVKQTSVKNSSPKPQFSQNTGTKSTGNFPLIQKGSSSMSQFGQNTGIKGQSTQQTIGFGQQPFGSSQTTSSTFSQNTFGSGSQFGQNPQQQQSIILGTKGKIASQNSPYSQFATKVGSSQSATGTLQTSVESSSPVSQSSYQQNKDTIYHYDKPGVTIFSNKETSKLSGFQLVDGSRTSLINQNEKQTSFGSSSIGSPFGQHLQRGSGSSASAVAQVQPQSQYDRKAFSSQSVIGTFPFTQKGSSSFLQFDQNTGIKEQSTQQTTGFGQQPFGSSQTSSRFSQNTFGTTSGLQFGQNPQQQQSTVQGTKGKIATQNSPDSQFATKVDSSQSTAGSLQTSVKNSPVSQFDQITNTKGIGNFPLTQKGSSSVSQFVQNTGIKGQSIQQTIGFGQQPFGSSQTTSSTFSQNTFGGKSGSQFGQNPQQQQSTDLGTKGKIASQNSPYSQFATKVGSSQSATGTSQTSVESSSPVSQSSYQQNKDTIYHYDKPGVTIFSNKEASKLSGFQLVDGSRTSFSNQNEKQSSFGSSSIASQFGQHLQPGSGSSASAVAQVQPQSQYDRKASSSQSIIGRFPSTQKGSSSVSQFDQNTGLKGQSTQQTTGFGQQPFGSSQTTSSTFSQNNFGGTSGSQFGQNPQQQQSIVLGTKGKIGSQNSPYSQFATKVGSSQSATGTSQTSVESSSPVSQSSYQQNKDTIYHYDKPGVTIFSNKETSKLSGFQLVDGSRTSLINQNEKQSSFGSSSIGSPFGQHLQRGSGSSASAVAQVQPQSQYDRKAFSSQSVIGTFPSTQKGSSSLLQFDQNTGIKGQSTQQTTGFGQQPFGSSQTTSSTFSQNTFGTTSGLQLGQNTQQQQSTVLGTKEKIATQNSPYSQFATKVYSSQSTAGTVQTLVKNSLPVSQFGQNTGPKGTGNFALTQKGTSSVSKFSQNTTGLGQQPFGSSQTTSSTFSQNTFGGKSGLQFGQNPKQQQSTVLGTKGKTAFQKSPYSQFATKVESSQSATGTLQTSMESSLPVPLLDQNTGTKCESAQQELGQRPFGFSYTTGSNLSQYSIGCSQGSQSSPQQKKGTIYHYNTPSVTIFSNKETSKLSGLQLVGGSKTSLSNQNVKQSSFGSSSTGSQFGQHLLTESGSSASAAAQVQPQSQYNTKAFGSQSATGTFPSTQKGSSSVSQFGQNTGIKGYSQSTQQTTGFGQQPFGPTQTTASTFSQNTFGSASGPQFGQKPQFVLGTKGKIALQNSPHSQFVNSESIRGTLQSVVTQSETLNDLSNNGGSQFPESPKGSQISSLSSQFINKLNQPFVNTQTPFLSQYDYISEQRPQNTASAFATSNLVPNGDIATDRVFDYQFTQFGNAASETAKPFVNSLLYSTHASPDSFSNHDDNINNFSTSSDFGILEHRQLSSQPIVPSRPTVHSNTKTKIIPGTQISIDQLRSAVADSKIKAKPYTFNEKSSQSSGTQLNGAPLKSYDISSFGLRSQHSSKFPSTVSIAQASVSNVNYEKQPYNSFVGSKELFAEHREPPKFDIKTGYHY